MHLENQPIGILMLNCSRILLFVIILFSFGKIYFENLKQWWDIGKTQIKMFCLQYSANCSSRIKNVIESLEKQINAM